MNTATYQGTDSKERRDEDGDLFLYARPDTEPDYEIESISTYHDHITILAKKVRADG